MQITLARAETGIPARNVMICYMKGFTLTTWRSVRVLLASSAYVVEAASLYRKSDVLAARMHLQTNIQQVRTI